MAATVKYKVWKIDEQHIYPWRFSLNIDGKEMSFAGIPNYCETKRSAIARAAWRKKWVLEGTFNNKYK